MAVIAARGRAPDHAQRAELPEQVVRVARDAVAADTGPGAERHEPERLRGGGLEDLIELDAQVRGRRLHLVREGDVDRPERISRSSVNSAASGLLTVWVGATRPMTAAARAAHAGPGTPPTTRGTTDCEEGRGPDRCER